MQMLVKSAKEAAGGTISEVNEAGRGMLELAKLMNLAKKVPGASGSSQTAGVGRDVANQTAIGLGMLSQGKSWGALRIFGDMREAQLMTFMDKVMSTPEGMEFLAKLGRDQGMNMTKANTLVTGLQTLSGAAEAAGNPAEIQPNTPPTK